MIVIDKRSRKKPRQIGTCRICGEVAKLTKEHVPPRSAFNDGNFLERYIDQARQTKDFNWSSRDTGDGGVYLFTLCERCNNRTGKIYGGAYVDFIKAFTSLAVLENADTTVELEFQKIFPLRIVKQTISMILSTSEVPSSYSQYSGIWNPSLDHFPSKPENLFGSKPDLAKLQDSYRELQSFVAVKEHKGLPAGVRLYVHLVANQGIGWRTGLAGIGRRNTKSSFWAVTVGLWPVQWVMTVEGVPDAEMLDVTDWASSDYKESRSKQVKIPCHWMVSSAPFDYRSPQEVQKTSLISHMKIEGFEFETGANKEQMFEGAMSFARKRGVKTLDGLLVSEFQSGIYVEVKETPYWIRGAQLGDAMQIIASVEPLTIKPNGGTSEVSTATDVPDDGAPSAVAGKPARKAHKKESSQ